jgi:hypothetical protein
MTTVALDSEVYRDYFLVVMKSTDGRLFKISKHNNVVTGNIGQLKGALRRHIIITFNGENYDLPVIAAFLAGWSNRRIKELSDRIIKSGDPWWKLKNDYSIRVPKCDHVDLIGVTPLKASLKTYMARIQAPTIQDLPIHPDAVISDDDAVMLERYCENDVDGTLQIFNTLKPELKLRVAMQRQYGIDFRSKSDPQIAEAILRSKLFEAGHSADKRAGRVKPFRYRVPDFIRFETAELNKVLATIRDTELSVNDNGYVELPKHLEEPIEFAGAKYKLGIGGIHSQEKKQIIKPGPDELYGEFDVASMYPGIILGQGLYPSHLDPAFCDIYREIFNERMLAKASGNKTVADTLKIVLNSSYGKFGSRYSFLYAPELLVQTTLTGQLSLLMLIERLSGAGMSIKSANTDGVNVLMRRDQQPQAQTIADQWSTDTTYTLEWTEYTSQYSRDVNSYIAFKADGVKTKGNYEYGSIRKGHSNEVCIDAVINYLRDGTPIEDTVTQCADIRRFTTMRGVRGGGTWRGQDLGKVVRWYVGNDGEPIHYRSNGTPEVTAPFRSWSCRPPCRSMSTIGFTSIGQSNY